MTLGEIPEELGCKYYKINAGLAYCSLQDGGQDILKNESPRKYKDCPGCVDVPLVEKLFNGNKPDENKRCRDEIRQALKLNRACMAFGAGISIPMGMPNWYGLISQLSGYASQYSNHEAGHSGRLPMDVELERKLVSGELKLFSGVNVLESGQYIEESLRHTAKDRSVQELLKEALSSIIENSLTPAQWNKDRDKELEKSPKTDCAGCQLKAKDKDKDKDIIAAEHNSLCAAAYLLAAENGFRRAMTYNYDTLVQEYLIDIFRVSQDRIFTHSGKWSDYSRKDIEDPIDIFHVHGCIPRRIYQKTPSSAFPGESEKIILSESSYYNTEQLEAYNWMNSIQSYYLNRDSCVFVGFSADDYNFRRILKQLGKSSHPKHYLILTIDDMVRDTWASVCRHHMFSNTDTEQIRRETLRLIQMQLDMKTEYWNQYNFHPIWVTINDVPRYLLSLVT